MSADRGRDPTQRSTFRLPSPAVRQHRPSPAESSIHDYPG